jgi:hypothetical protein
MTFTVSGKEKELVAMGKNGIEWTEDLLGNHNALNFDEESEAYVMSEDDFDWWEEIVEKLNEIQELESGLSSEESEEYTAQQFEYSVDLETETDSRLDYLKSIKAKRN